MATPKEEGDDKWWQRAREQTPGCAHVVHLNNAGASLPPHAVIDAVAAYTRDEQLLGGYEAAEMHADALRGTHAALAQLLNAPSPNDVAVVSSATEAWRQAFYGLRLNPGDVVLTNTAEYGSNAIAYLQQAARTGAVVRVVPDGVPGGDVCLDSLRRELGAQPRPALVSMCMVPTNSGRVLDAAAVGALASAAGVPFLLDACQAVGQVELDVQALRCDFLTGTARKYLRGPRGAGFLYVQRAALRWHEPATLDNTGATLQLLRAPGADSGGDAAPAYTYMLAPTAAAQYGQYEMSFTSKVGLGAAVRYLLDDVGQRRAFDRIAALAAEARRRLAAEVPGLTVHDPNGVRLCGIVSFSLQGWDVERLRLRLARRDGGDGDGDGGDGDGAGSSDGGGDNNARRRRRPVNVSVSGAPSTLFDFHARALPPALLRASFHYYNDSGDVDALVDALRDAVAG